jgi:hypothetical protein
MCDTAKISILLIWMVLASPASLCAQGSNTSKELADHLLIQVRTGQAGALRDYATLFDEPETGIGRALSAAIKQRGAATSKWKQRSDFYDFYYQNRSDLRFDASLAAYYVYRPNDTTVYNDFLVRPKEVNLLDHQQAVNLAQEAITAADTAGFDIGMQLIATLPSLAQDTIVLSLYARYKAQKIKTPALVMTYFDRVFSRQLAANQQVAAVPLLVEILDHKTLPPALVQELGQIASGRQCAHYAPSQMRDSLVKWSREIPEPYQMRIAGLEQSSGSSRAFFESDAEFAGWMTIKLDSIPALKSALLQMLFRDDDPRALGQLGALVARLRWDCIKPNQIGSFIARSIVEAIESRTGTEISVPNQNGATVPWATDPVWMLHYGLYWESHWEDYTYDKRKQHFSHKASALNTEEAVANLFQQLASTKDSIALTAYQALAEADPGTVLRLLPDYTELIRQPNTAVPPLKRHFLRAAVTLKDWGKDFGLLRKLPVALEQNILQLLQPMGIEQRYALEQQLIETTTIQDLMVLDIYLITKLLEEDAAFSASRILDQLYSKHWKQICTNQLLLRIYLKKAAVFRTVQTTGTLHQYLKKIDQSDQTLMKQLAKLKLDETDTDIQQALASLLSPQQGTQRKEQEVLSAEALQRIRESVFAGTEPDFNLINRVTLHPDFRKDNESEWLRTLLQKWPQIAFVQNVILSEKLSAKYDAMFFQDVFSTPEAYIAALHWYEMDDATVLLNHLSTMMPPDMVQQGGYWFQILRSESCQKWLLQQNTPIKDAQKIQKALSAWYDTQDYISEQEEGEVKLLLLLLEHTRQPLSEKLVISCAIPSAQHKAIVQRSLLSVMQFADLEAIEPSFSCIADDQTEPLLLNTLRDLGLPPSFDKTGQLHIASLKDQNTAIKSGLEAFGIHAFSNANLPDYAAVSQVLEYELITPWVGGGGVRRDIYAFSTIKMLEQTHQNSLGFHPKLNENQTFFTYNAAERAQAWLTFLESHQLMIPVHGRPLSWQ